MHLYDEAIFSVGLFLSPIPAMQRYFSTLRTYWTEDQRLYPNESMERQVTRTHDGRIPVRGVTPDPRVQTASGPEGEQGGGAPEHANQVAS